MTNSMIEGSFKEYGNSDTADSDYFQKRNLRSQLQTQQLADCSDASHVEQLEEQLARVKQTVLTNSDWIGKLKSKEELNGYQNETLQELLIEAGKSQAELELSKFEFQKAIAALERRLACYRSQCKQLKQKKQAEIQQAVEDLKTSTKQNQTYIADLVKDTGTKISTKLSNFTKQIKAIRKIRVDKKSQLMQSIEGLRGTLQLKLQRERKNRADYQSIVLTLLDKTCSEGEHLLRRICI